MHRHRHTLAVCALCWPCKRLVTAAHHTCRAAVLAGPWPLRFFCKRYANMCLLHIQHTYLELKQVVSSSDCVRAWIANCVSPRCRTYYEYGMNWIFSRSALCVWEETNTILHDYVGVVADMGNGRCIFYWVLEFLNIVGVMFIAERCLWTSIYRNPIRIEYVCIIDSFDCSTKTSDCHLFCYWNRLDYYYLYFHNGYLRELAMGHCIVSMVYIEQDKYIW